MDAATALLIVQLRATVQLLVLKNLVTNKTATPFLQALPLANLVRATFNFPAAAQGFLTFTVGDIIILTSDEDPNWWYGERDGIRGLFPANRVERIDLK
ncbi:SH3 domain-containing protein [Mycena galopus ATCC 62051]|nr:SH3 domain-containing protein [Mycena galopus ATCC 62051]